MTIQNVSLSQGFKDQLNDMGLMSPVKFTELGDLCKTREIELRTLDVIPSTSHFIIRVDGRSFSKFTQNFTKPFDDIIAHVMTDAAKAVCADLKCTFAYTESDEITYVFKSKQGENFQHTFGGKVAKLITTCAALTSVAFYKAIMGRCPMIATLPHFDARLVDVVDRNESNARLMRAVVWRQNDAIRNSVSMVAQSKFSHRELQGVNTVNKLAMIEERCDQQGGLRWWQYSSRHTKGTFIYLKTTEREFTEHELAAIPESCRPDPGTRFMRTALEITTRENLCTVAGTDYQFSDIDSAFNQAEVQATLEALNW